MSLFVLSVPCCLTCLFLACPPFQATRTGQVCSPFLGKPPKTGVGPASRAAQSVLVCTQPRGPGVCQISPNMLLCVYSISEVIKCQEKGAQRSQLSLSPFEMQNSLLSGRCRKSCALAQPHGQHHLLPDGRKQACRRSEEMPL